MHRPVRVKEKETVTHNQQLMSTTVYLAESRRGYYPHVKALHADGCMDVVEASDKRILNSFRNCVENDQSATFVVDIHSVDLISSILHIAKSNAPITSAVNIIVVTDLETWCRTPNKFNAASVDSGFRARQPLIGAIEKYSLENILFDIARSGLLSIKLVHLGLIYGGKGYDFEFIFKDIWNANFAVTSSTPKKIIGHIHFRRLRELFASLITAPWLFPVLIPAFDYNAASLSLSELLSECNRLVNGAQPLSHSSEPSTNVDALIAQVHNSADIAAFISTMHSSQHGFDKAHNVLSDWESVWKEFVQENGLKNVHIAISGPPKCGKTEHAKLLADRLQLEYIDVVAGVVHVLQRVPSPKQNDADALTAEVANDPFIELRQGLVTSLDAKLNEGAKPKAGKDKNAPVTLPSVLSADGTVDLSQVTLSLVLSAVSAEVQRQCLQELIAANVVCQRRGWVLDVWELEGLRSVRDYLASSVDIIIDLKIDDKVQVSKLQDSYGAGFAKNKEAQNAVKALETLLAGYSSAFIAADNEQDAIIHPSVQAILSLPSVCSLRYDLAASTMIVEDRVNDIVIDVLNQKPSALGWVSRPSVSPIATSSSGTAVDATQSTEHGLPDVGKAEKSPLKIPSGVEALNEFLANNVLAVLADGMIQAVRTDVADPIGFLADFLLRESTDRQRQSEEDARRNFEIMLRS